MNQMLTSNSYRQPTLTQMDFVQNCPPPKPRLIPSGWQYTVEQTTGDPFYVNGASGRVIYKYDNMFGRLKKPPKLSQAVTPTDRLIQSAIKNMIPDVAVSSHVYSMPPSMKTHRPNTWMAPWPNPSIWMMMRSVWLVRPYLTSATHSFRGNSQFPGGGAEKGLYPFNDTRCCAKQGTLGD
jgi:hypothetical protein